jgi:hypothetical protein
MVVIVQGIGVNNCATAILETSVSRGGAGSGVTRMMCRKSSKTCLGPTVFHLDSIPLVNAKQRTRQVMSNQVDLRI